MVLAGSERAGVLWRGAWRGAILLILPWTGRVAYHDAQHRERGGVIVALHRRRHPTPLRNTLRVLRSDPPSPGEGKDSITPCYAINPRDGVFHITFSAILQHRTIEDALNDLATKTCNGRAGDLYSNCAAYGGIKLRV